MRSSEILALVYFICVGAAALALSRRRTGWLRACGWASAGVLVVITATLVQGLSIYGGGHVDARDWWLLLAMPLAYWAPAPLVDTANLRLERWLQRIDDGLGLTALDPGAHGLLELSYLLVYPIVPAGLLAVTRGDGAVTADAFWLGLFASVLPCYGLLPLLPTRPPRAFLLPTTSAVATPARRANVTFLATFGNSWNTLPSGHAAGATAVAVMVWRSGSPLAPVFVLLAIGIALGTVRGRYHYAVDTILGVTLGIIASSLA